MSNFLVKFGRIGTSLKNADMAAFFKFEEIRSAGTERGERAHAALGRRQ